MKKETLDIMIDFLKALDTSEYGKMVGNVYSDSEYRDAQREYAGLMDFTSEYGSQEDEIAWSLRKHLAKIVIDGLRFDTNHMNRKAVGNNDHLRELACLVATFPRHNPTSHDFFMNSIFFDYYRDWTNNNFDSEMYVEETIAYNYPEGYYYNAKTPFTQKVVNERRERFVDFWSKDFFNAFINELDKDEDLRQRFMKVMLK